MYCDFCGEELRRGSLRCPSCGNNVIEETEDFEDGFVDEDSEIDDFDPSMFKDEEEEEFVPKRRIIIDKEHVIDDDF